MVSVICSKFIFLPELKSQQNVLTQRRCGNSLVVSMFTNLVLIFVNFNHWSKILSTTLTFTVTHGKHRYLPQLYDKLVVESPGMSENNNEFNFVGGPSTSGSNSFSWYCNCTRFDNSSCQVHWNYPNNASNEGVSNLIVVNPIMSIPGIASAFSDSRYCQVTNAHFTSQSYQENIGKFYYHKRQTPREERKHTGGTSGQALLSLRSWKNISDENSKSKSKPGFIFTIMCYNVLAQDLLAQHPQLYNFHNNEALEWKRRWKNLFNEIKQFSPDILCLQEVQESHISTDFSLLETLGYKSLYKKRTGIRTDGCALYYKTSLINLVEYTTVEYYQPHISILDRDNVGIIAKFSPKLHPTREFVVATTHLLYNPKRQDIRLAQTQVLLTEVERISYNEKSKNGHAYLPVIITGDLNSSPDTALYDFITKGKLTYEHLSPKSLTAGTKTFTGKVLVPRSLRITDNCQHADLLQKRINNVKTTRSEELSIIALINSGKQIQKQSEEREKLPELFSTGTLSHNFALKSVYSHGQQTNMEATTFQDKWLTVDYIFYSAKDKTYTEDKLKLLSRYRLPTEAELTGVRIPNSVLGSDHLSLLAKFKLEF